MAQPWSQVSTSPDFQAMPPAAQEAARQQYFTQVVQPSVPPEQLQQVKAQFDQQTGPPPPPAPDETPSRIAGLAGRAAVKGIGEIADIPSNLLHAADSAGQAIRAKGRSLLGLPAESLPQPASGTPSAASALDQASGGMMGLPTPATPGERVGSAAVAGAPTALLAPEAALTAGAAGMAGGASSQTAAEMGGSKLTQVIAGLAGGAAIPAAAAGAAAAIRGAVRGADGSQMAANAAALPGQTVGMAANSPVIQSLESTLARIPGGGAIRNAVANLNTKIADQSASIVDNLRGAADAEPASAGDMMTQQLTAASKRIDAARGVPFDAIDAAVPADARIEVTSLRQKLYELTTPPQAGKNFGGALIDPRLSKMRNALEDDIEANNKPIVSPLRGPDDQPFKTSNPLAGTSLPMEAVRDWKTRLGGTINWTGFGSSDPINGALKQVWGSLKDDINTGAVGINPKLGPMIAAANSQYKVAQAQLENLGRVVDKAGGPEKVFTGLMSGTKDGSTALNQVLPQLDPAGRQLLAATQLRRMGLANPGQQGAAGDEFSAATFLTNWNKMHADARSQLFGQLPNNYSQNVTKLAHDAELLRKFNKVSPNSSGTAAASAGATALTGGILAAVTGHPAVLAALGGTYGASRVLAATLTSPKTVAWLVKPTQFAGSKTAAAASGAAAANNAAQQPPASPAGQ